MQDIYDLIFLVFNKIATYRINSRWQVYKEALWFIKSPTYLSKFTPPFLGICRFYIKYINTTSTYTISW